MNPNEQDQARIIFEKLTTPLDANGNAELAKRFLRGGFGQEGFGVAEGAAISGSFALAGNQGYYAHHPKVGGKQVFFENVSYLREFFSRRGKILGKPIRYVIKTGIGGQHTPFQGISDAFKAIPVLKVPDSTFIESEPGTFRTGTAVEACKQRTIITGEYELGKNYDHELSMRLEELEADWDQIAVIPSSKSGSTDETMLIFVEIFAVILNHVAQSRGIDGDRFSKIVLETLHDLNFLDGKERAGKDLFKVEKDRSGTESLIELICERANCDGRGGFKTRPYTPEQVHEIFGIVLGNMFFETTDRSEASRLSAFIRNSGLDKELGENAPGFGGMFDNVGGRWTGDLHMMTFLAFYNLDEEAYWNERYAGIMEVRKETHAAVELGNMILEESVTDIALLVPEELFWFGKSVEQNFNESIWQEGFANLITVCASDWDAQKKYYRNEKSKLVINLSKMEISREKFNAVVLETVDFKAMKTKEEVAQMFARLFSAFYGLTTTVGNRLMARAILKAGFAPDLLDLSRLEDPATRLFRDNLYLLQPYVELGKGLLEGRLSDLQAKEAKEPGAIACEMERVTKLAKERCLETNIPNLQAESAVPLPIVPGSASRKPEPGTIGNGTALLVDVLKKIRQFAETEKRKIVPFIYLEGEKFYGLRDALIDSGVEWVMQGTGDQHISYQQVLAQPRRFLPFIISFIPEKPFPGYPAIGFAKGYLHRISSHMVRDFFAEASYQALTEKRASSGGKGVFLRLIDSTENISLLREMFK